MVVPVLLTGFALFAAAFCVYFAWRAGESAERAAHSEHRLAIMRGQVAGLCTSIEVLDDKQRRLAGRVYADQYWRGQREEQPELAPVDDLPRAPMGDECENWKRAQQLGPSSPEASCKCAYCESKRADRAARRAKLRAGVKS